VNVEGHPSVEGMTCPMEIIANDKEEQSDKIFGRLFWDTMHNEESNYEWSLVPVVVHVTSRDIVNAYPWDQHFCCSTMYISSDPTSP